MLTAKTSAAILAFAGVATAQCGAAAVDELTGYGVGTTGGGDGAGTTVTSCADFESAAEAGGVITVSGTLDGCGIIDLASDTTLIGTGADSGFTNGGVRIKEATNVIVRNLNFYEATEGGDLIDIDASTYVWVDHCSFSNPTVDDKDFYDGLLDAKHGSDFLTFSWNTFTNHWKGTLIGHSASNADEDEGHLKVTYHHNYFSNVNSRLPSLRFGTGHIYSSCFEDAPTSGINIREGAVALVEENSFTNVQLAITTDLDADIQGFAIDLNNIFDNSDINITQEGSLDIPYEYTVDTAACACEVVNASAGPGVIA